MAALVNKSFETAGTPAGRASGWTTTLLGTAEAYLNFSGASGALPNPVEDHEVDWKNNEDDVMVIVGGTAMDFNTGVLTTQVESHEVGWLNNEDSFVVAGGAAPTLEDGFTVESHENNWDNDADRMTIVGGVAGTTESHESGWGNDDDEVEIVASSPASFDEGAATVETHAGFLPPVSFIVVSSVFFAAAHPFANTNRVRVKGPGLSAELVPGLTYYVVNKATNSFQLALTSGGGAISVTNSSAPTMTIFGDPAVYWVESYD